MGAQDANELLSKDFLGVIMRYIMLLLMALHASAIQAQAMSDIASLKAYSLMKCLQINHSGFISEQDASYFSFEFVKNQRLEFEELQLIDRYVYENVKAYAENTAFLKNDILPKQGNTVFYQCYVFSESKALNQFMKKYMN